MESHKHFINQLKKFKREMEEKEEIERYNDMLTLNPQLKRKKKKKTVKDVFEEFDKKKSNKKLNDKRKRVQLYKFRYSKKRKLL